MNLLINDVKKALDAEAYFAALSLVLTLPDICAKAEYGDTIKSNKKRYIKWYDKYIGQNQKAPPCEGEPPFPYLSGEVVYSLRNCVLHQGEPTIEKEKITDEINKIDYFELCIQKENRCGAYVDSAHIQANSEGVVTERSYCVNVRRLCSTICGHALWYYNNNLEKFDFSHVNIVDWDKEIEQLRS